MFNLCDDVTIEYSIVMIEVRVSPLTGKGELAKISGHKDVNILINTYYAPDVSDFAARLG